MYVCDTTFPAELPCRHHGGLLNKVEDEYFEQRTWFERARENCGSRQVGLSWCDKRVIASVCSRVPKIECFRWERRNKSFFPDEVSSCRSSRKEVYDER